MSSKYMHILNSFVNDIFERIVSLRNFGPRPPRASSDTSFRPLLVELADQEASKLARYSKKKTIHLTRDPDLDPPHPPRP